LTPGSESGYDHRGAIRGEWQHPLSIIVEVCPELPSSGQVRSSAGMLDDLASGPPRGYRRATLVLLLAMIGACSVIIVEQWLGALEQKPLPQSRLTDVASVSSVSHQERSTSYMGPASCAECHPGEAALFARSGHHRTLWPTEPGRNPVVAWLKGKTWKDPDVPDVTWSYQVRDGRLVAERTIRERIETLRLEYGLGSGTHGITFVAFQPGDDPAFNPSGIEHRLSYYSTGRRLGVTLGQKRFDEDHTRPDEVPFGKSLPPERLQRCIGCHSTLTSTLAGTWLEPATLIPNVTCERCHGPGRVHIETARRGESELTMAFGQNRAGPSVEVALCGECHRLPQSISASSIRPGNLEIVRFQPVGLSESLCYAKGQSGLRCVSCHDPHDRASSDQAAYVSVCLQCHQAGSKSKQATCPVAPAARCIECHMPRREISGNGFFTDHWIRKPETTARRAGAAGKQARERGQTDVQTR
jgi:hypothetical protein